MIVYVKILKESTKKDAGIKKWIYQDYKLKNQLKNCISMFVACAMKAKPHCWEKLKLQNGGIYQVHTLKTQHC